jgi:hypothetical protein
MMRNAILDRRRFLQWGALGGMMVAAGCSGGDGASEVKTPPVAGKGNRMLLQKAEEVAKSAPAPGKGKRKMR